MLEIKNYKKVESLEEAWTLNQKKSNRVLGGMMWLKMSHGRADTVIDLSGLGLDKIEEAADAFRIGCMVTLRQLELDAGLNSYACGAVRDAVCQIVGVQFRNLATIGGSIWGRYGFSDLLTVFMALGASVELYKGGIVPLKEFAERKADRDILVRIIVPKVPGTRFAYLSYRNTETDLPVLNTAAAVQVPDAADAGSPAAEATVLRLVVGARPQKAMEADLSGCPETTFSTVAEYTAQQIPTESNMRGSAAYRTRLVKVLTKRVLKKAVTAGIELAENCPAAGSGAVKNSALSAGEEVSV